MGKIKEVFSDFCDFLNRNLAPLGRNHQNAEKKCAGFHPKVPEGPQSGGKQGKKQHCSAQCTQKYISPQDALRPAQCEKEQRTAKPRAIDGVQRSGQAGTALPYCAQQIIQQSGGRTQQLQLFEQAPEKAALIAGGVLIGYGIDAAVHMQFTAVQRKFADVQVLPGDHHRTGTGGQDDTGLIKTLYILHAGYRQFFPSLQLQSVLEGHGRIVFHVIPSSLSTSYGRVEGNMPYRPISR